MRGQDLCVIVNPAAGKQRGRERLAQIKRAWTGHAVFQPTTHPGHAAELAERAASQGFSVVAAAGGDGTAHEVLNGLMRAGNPDVAFSIIPIGSANDYAYSLSLENPETPALRRVDIGLATTPAGRKVYFGCCLGMGLNGRVAYESRRIRKLQGVFLYGLAALRSIIHHFDAPAMTLLIDDEPAWTVPTLLFSVLAGKREGGFLFAPQAEVDDGWLDFVHAGDLSRWEILKLLPRLATSGPPANYPKVRQGRCRRVKVHSEAPLLAHADGEFVCLPEENMHALEIELLRGILPVRVI
jgi:diacylglycerol kinase family enzyme